MRINSKLLQNILITAALLAFSVLLIFSIFKIISSFGSDDISDTDTDALTSSKSIERDGTVYFPKQDITTFLIIGTDRDGAVEKSEFYTNDVCADFVMLAVFDNTDQTYKVININRDTMLNMPVLGVNGKVAGITYAQLALSHTYGTGLSDSCINTRKAVSDFLYGVNINYYASFSMDAIALLNDAVGGVKVNVTDDFSAVDPSIMQGEMVLTGAQAFSYLRSRRGVGDQLNTSRMKRQKEYMDGFALAFKDKFSENETDFIKLYDSLVDYMVTDCSSSVLSTLASRYCDYKFNGVISPEGESKLGETSYMEFYADQNALDKLIIDELYAPKANARLK